MDSGTENREPDTVPYCRVQYSTVQYIKNIEGMKNVYPLAVCQSEFAGKCIEYNPQKDLFVIKPMKDDPA